MDLYNEFYILLFLIAVIGLHLSVFMQGYYVFDTFEYLIDGISGVLSGLILCTIYFTDLSKKFKWKFNTVYNDIKRNSF